MYYPSYSILFICKQKEGKEILMPEWVWVFLFVSTPLWLYVTVKLVTAAYYFGRQSFLDHQKDKENLNGDKKGR